VGGCTYGCGCVGVRVYANIIEFLGYIEHTYIGS
jgi:hypothetical protein